MSFQNSLKILQGSKEFKRFKEKHKNTFLFSAFFALNSKLELETQQLDYIIGKTKVATFLVSEEGKIEYKEDEINPTSELSALDEKIKIDIEKLKKIIEGEIKRRALTEFNISKIFIVLQKINNVQLWNVTCLMDCLKILRIHVDCFNGKVLEEKEESIADFLSFQKGNKK
ncbi:MAG: hypothetical protein ACPLXC_00300 [Candidatus Pacearchaeota archaeon]